MSDRATQAATRAATLDPEAQAEADHRRWRSCQDCGGCGWSAPWTRCECMAPPSVEEASSWLPPAVERIDDPLPKALLDEQRERWLGYGLAAGHTDRVLAGAGVRLAYEAAGLEAPSAVVWLPSPLAGAVGAAQLQVGDQVGGQVWGQVGGQVGDQVGGQVWGQVGGQVGDQVGDQVWDQVWGQVWGQVGGQVGDQVGDQVWDQVGDQVGDQVWDQVWGQVWDQVGDQVGDQVWDQVWGQVGGQVYRACYGSHDAHWLAYYESFARGGLRAPIALRGLSWVAMAAGWWWPFRGAVVLTERPTVYEPGPSGGPKGGRLTYSDGWRVSL